MPEVIFPGPEGRLEGRFSPGPRPRAPVALILHPHPQGGGTMNNAIVQALYKTFVRRGFATLRFNFRGVGKSQGVFDNGIGELSDAAEVEAQGRESAPHERLVERLDDGVVHRAAALRVRVEDQGDRRARARAGAETAFKAAFGAGKDDFGHRTCGAV